MQNQSFEEGPNSGARDRTKQMIWVATAITPIIVASIIVAVAPIIGHIAKD